MSKSPENLQPSPMSELRQALETEREIELPMDPAYYDRLHARIMGAIDRRSKNPAPLPANSPPVPQFTDARTNALAAMTRVRSAE